MGHSSASFRRRQDTVQGRTNHHKASLSIAKEQITKMTNADADSAGDSKPHSDHNTNNINRKNKKNDIDGRNNLEGNNKSNSGNNKKSTRRRRRSKRRVHHLSKVASTVIADIRPIRDAPRLDAFLSSAATRL